MPLCGDISQQGRTKAAQSSSSVWSQLCSLTSSSGWSQSWPGQSAWKALTEDVQQHLQLHFSQKSTESTSQGHLIDLWYLEILNISLFWSNHKTVMLRILKSHPGLPHQCCCGSDLVFCSIFYIIILFFKLINQTNDIVFQQKEIMFPALIQERIWQV